MRIQLNKQIVSKNKNLRKVYKASAPGSLMLLGEHAVLHGKMALVCAINKRISVTLKPRKDRHVCIRSKLLGTLNTSLDDLQIVAPFQFVLSAICLEKKFLCCGFDLLITADFSSKMGFGSSAAVTVATLAVLHCWIKQQKPQERELFLKARRIIRKVQGVGSGADAAASIFGGVVAYRTAPLLIEKIANSMPLTVVYSGQKVATKQVVQQVFALRQRHKKIIGAVEVAIEKCVKDAIFFIKKRKWKELGEVINICQGLQDAFGVNTDTLAKIIFALRKTEGVYGAKISGSGLGDCVIGIGMAKKSIIDDKNTNFSTSKICDAIDMVKNVDVARDGLFVE